MMGDAWVLDEDIETASKSDNAPRACAFKSGVSIYKVRGPILSWSLRSFLRLIFSGKLPVSCMSHPSWDGKDG